MGFDFYLSEMSISDRHGGGLTIQRVLRDDLGQFQIFAHVNRFAADHPAIDRVKPRCLDLRGWAEGDQTRKIIGCRPAQWLEKSWMAQRWHGRRCAAEIASRFRDVRKPLRGLVCPQGTDSMHTIDSLLRRRPIDYVTWVMDDHLIRWRAGAWRYPSRRVESLFARHLQNAKSVIVISPAMGEFYRKRFGIESEVLFGPADAPETITALSPNRNRSIRLGYFGALEAWQLDALALVAQSAAKANASLDIYSARARLPVELAQQGVSLKDRLAPVKIIETMRTYDAVVLPISFRPELRHLSEFNIATKMSECLASGVITLAVGPPYAVMIRLLQMHRAGFCITDASVEAVVTSLAALRDCELVQSISRAATDFVATELCTQAMRAPWAKVSERLNDTGQSVERPR